LWSQRKKTNEKRATKNGNGKNGSEKNGQRKIGQRENSATKTDMIGNTTLLSEITKTEKTTEKNGNRKKWATGKFCNE